MLTHVRLIVPITVSTFQWVDRFLRNLETKAHQGTIKTRTPKDVHLRGSLNITPYVALIFT